MCGTGIRPRTISHIYPYLRWYACGTNESRGRSEGDAEHVPRVAGQFRISSNASEDGRITTVGGLPRELNVQLEGSG